MDFHLLVSNLFIQEGIRSILMSKYPASFISVMQDLDEFKADTIQEHAIIITNNPSLFYNYQPKFKNLILKKQIKTVLIANSVQIEQLKEKDLKLVDALIYTNCSLNDLDEALSYVQSGLIYRCKRFQPVNSTQNTFEALLNEQQVSSREMEIIKLVIAGQTSQEIAEKLNISYYTVTTHRRNINKKLNIKNPQDLLRLSLDNKRND
jgi:DNA-binding NarL/FixJ family response regulator